MQGEIPRGADHGNGDIPLLPMQRAYLCGGKVDVFDHDEPTHAFFELVCENVGRDRLLWALERLLRTHETFRMAILSQPLGAIQRLLPNADVDMSCQHDACGLDTHELGELLSLERKRLFALAFDPTTHPRHALSIVWYGTRSARILVAFDGMLLDGHSVSLFCKELDALLRTGKGCVNPSLTSYVHARTELDDAYARSDVPARDEAFWYELLDGCLEVPTFGDGDGRRGLSTVEPEDVIVDGGPTFQVCVQIESDAWREFCESARDLGVTPFALAFTLYGHAIARHCGTTDFAISVPQRPPQWFALPDVMGMTSSFAPLPFHDGPQPLVEQAAAVLGTLFEMFDHTQLGGPDLLKALTRHTGQLVQIPLTFTLMTEDLPDEACVATRHVRIHTSQTLIETSLFARVDGSAELALSVRTSEISRTVAAGIAQMLADGIADFASGRLDEKTTELPLPPVERACADSAGGLRMDPPAESAGRMGTPAPEPGPLSALLAKSLVAHGPQDAVLGDFGHLSHAELAAWCHTLLHQMEQAWPDLEHSTVTWPYDRTQVCAHVLEHHQTVGLLLPKGHLQVVASIACLVGSVSYMPINPNLPAASIAAACANAGVCRLVVAPDTLSLAHEVEATRVDGLDLLVLDDSRPAADPGPSELTLRHLHGYTPHLLCINTSGSTGAPKTISINDWALSNCLRKTTGAYDLDGDVRALALTNIGHDMALFDTIWPILHGGSIVVLDERVRREPVAWLDAMLRFGVNTWSSVPAFMQMFLELGPKRLAPAAPLLTTCILGGDFLSPSLCHDIWRTFPATRIFNCGGPSETTLWNISHEVCPGDLDRSAIPYGRPFPGSAYWVLDVHNRLCPPDVRGIMHVSGITLANGYLHENTLVQDGFGTYDGKVTYRTGDLGSYDGLTGEIAIHGRDDGQVKVNGKRIELGGIESALMRDTCVDQAVAVLHANGHIVAFVTTSETTDEQALRTRLEKTLPGYMVPTRIIVLETLPLTANTKVDRAALVTWNLYDCVPGGEDVARRRRPKGTGKQTDDNDARTRVEQAVQETLAEVFDTSVTPLDNFYHVGGDSVIAMRIVAQLGRKIGVDLAVYDLLGCPQIDGWVDLALARLLETGTTPVADPTEVRSRVTELVGTYLGGKTISLDDDFLALGGDVALAAVIARSLSREFNARVSRYDLIFLPRLRNWVELVCASARNVADADAREQA